MPSLPDAGSIWTEVSLLTKDCLCDYSNAGGKLVGEKPEFDDARSLLRSGPAGSLRTDIRAVSSRKNP